MDKPVVITLDELNCACKCCGTFPVKADDAVDGGELMIMMMLSPPPLNLMLLITPPRKNQNLRSLFVVV